MTGRLWCDLMTAGAPSGVSLMTGLVRCEFDDKPRLVLV